MNNFALSASMNSVHLWHRRLGHPRHASLSNLLSRFHTPCTNKRLTPSVCEACQQGKHVHLPFRNSNPITYFPFQIIHCDLWTSPIESITGFKCYLIVVDEYSRYIWTFPLHRKSDVLSTLRSFYYHILNQFYLSIQSIQCDNGKEFDNHDLHSFLQSLGIILRLSCPHT
jgi:transposase InsO family protein